MSTYSNRLQIELIGIGDQANAWGTTTNNNFSQSLEQSIAGVYTKNISSGTTTVLTSADGPQTQADNENRQAAIIFTNPSANHIVQFTAKEKLYFLRNNDTTYTVTARLGASGNTYVINPLAKWINIELLNPARCFRAEVIKPFLRDFKVFLNQFDLMNSYNLDHLTPLEHGQLYIPQIFEQLIVLLYYLSQLIFDSLNRYFHSISRNLNNS